MKLKVVFFRTETGSEPVRKWIKELSKAEKGVVGNEIKTVQFGWPLGMPLVRKIESGLWEVRIHLDNRIARVLFTTRGETMVLLHAFIKKSQKMPESDKKVARDRMKKLGG